MNPSKPADAVATASMDAAPAAPAEFPHFEPYEAAAGGWGALQATAKALREQSVVLKGGKSLLAMNQPDGFDCPGCAWPDPKHTSSFEFCENGAKAVAFELTSRRVTRELFAAHSVRGLEQQSDYWLEEQGRLTEPMRYDAASDHYVPIAWEEAFALIGRELRALESPDHAEFYTSGRTSNEAAFLFQLFVRRFGTNNFPDCSNMCHEPTSVCLPESIGIGKGTVIPDDFSHADAIFVIGQNPGTNSPRMMTELRNASRGSRRGGYGHGLAVDLVSVKGETRPERWISSEKLWNWIDAHGKEYGIGRPYRDKYAPHVAPIDGKEYADHRGGAHAQLAGLEARRYRRSSAQHDRKTTKRARAARLSRARST
jgi:Molybdopterin oxidoreductase